MTKPMRRDAARNRDRLLRAAADVFTEQGLAGSLEEVARRAGVSIGTLYNHFPTRDALIDALLPARVSAFDEIADRAAAEPDPWLAFTGFAEAMLDLLTIDRGLLEAFVGNHPTAVQLAEACARGMGQFSAVFERARRSGAIRPDATDTAVVNLLWALSLLGESAGESAWRESLPFVLDGLRAERA
ncbi:AcrR family transcriptional regulator [Nocardia transvalensis]|uniref:AcrR family transcriptional regulator n=1 Tax=Nocardia transvalensis TaxID=37333 RepID=A0A7W9PLS9_9NOCA|nr:TetR/AcrR family transcriptional regulator [Nocardia transvalensis]MBB5918506.1 AcrR family transcriptional regulator [Nocardia transvalensis]